MEILASGEDGGYDVKSPFVNCAEFKKHVLTTFSLIFLVYMSNMTHFVACKSPTVFIVLRHHVPKTEISPRWIDRYPVCIEPDHYH